MHADQLKSVFQFYATVGIISTSDIHSVGVRQFFQLVRDSKILTSKFSLAHVELLFVEITKSGENILLPLNISFEFFFFGASNHFDDDD
jgi:hypothetical protein